MAVDHEIRVRVLGTWESQRWCETCLVTTTWITVFLEVAGDGQAIKKCARHDLEIESA